MRKRLLALGLAGIMATSAALTGCFGSNGAVETKGEAAQTEGSEGGRIVITFWNGFTGSGKGTLEALVQKYNDTNDKDIEVQMNITSQDSLYQKLVTVLPVGEGPDIPAFAPQHLGTYAEPGALVPVDDAHADGIIGELAVPDALKDNLKWKGTYYGVSMDSTTFLLYYNKTIFTGARLNPETPPAIWDELEQYAEQIVEKAGKYGFDMTIKETTPMWCIMLWGNGGDFIKDGKAVSNSPENAETIIRWAENICDKKLGPEVLAGGEIDRLFKGQKLAVYFCESWATTRFKNVGIDSGAAQAPKGPEQQVTRANGVGMFLTASSKNKEAVYDFFKYWNSTDTQVEWYSGTGFPPVRTDIVDDTRLNESPYIKEFAKPANESQMYLQQLTNFADIENWAITSAFEKIPLQNVGVKESLDEANDIIQSMLEQDPVEENVNDENFTGKKEGKNRPLLRSPLHDHFHRIRIYSTDYCLYIQLSRIRHDVPELPVSKAG